MKVQEKINRIVDAAAAVSAIIGEKDPSVPEWKQELDALYQLRKDLRKLAEKLQGYS